MRDQAKMYRALAKVSFAKAAEVAESETIKSAAKTAIISIDLEECINATAHATLDTAMAGVGITDEESREILEYYECVYQGWQTFLEAHPTIKEQIRRGGNGI